MAKFTGSPALLPRQRPMTAAPRPVHAERPVQASRAVHAEPAHPINMTGLYAFQQEGVRWLHRRKRALLADEMGCISGDALVYVERSGAPDSNAGNISLSSLFHDFPKWSEGTTTIRAIDVSDPERGFVQSVVREVLDKGIRQVLDLRLVAPHHDLNLRMTADHEVACLVDGVVQFLAVSELTLGMLVLVDIPDIFRRQRPKAQLAAVRTVDHAGYAEVYDVVCADPHRNFVANGVVAHNCGKSPQALRSLPHGHGTIVVCPASLRLNWAREVVKFRPDLGVAVSSGYEYLKETFPDLRVRNYESGTLPAPMANEVVICSFEGLPDLPDQRDPKWLVPHALGDVTLVIDEAQKVKNPYAERTKKVRLLRRQCARVVGLTGTPMEGKPLDLWGVLESLGLHKAVFKNFSGFLRAFGAKRQHFGGFAFPPEPVEDVAAMLRLVMLRRLRRDVLPDLPPKTYMDEIVEAPPNLYAELDLVGKAWAGLDPHELPPFELMSTVRAKLAESRIDAVREFCDRYEEEGIPLVVFCSHTAPLEELVGGDMRQPREGWGCITGAVPQKERDFMVHLFQTGLLHGLAVATQAGGVGITLTRASHALFVDLSYTPSENKQAEDRLARIGQEAKSILITRMRSNHPVEERLVAILSGKETLIDATLGDSK